MQKILEDDIQLLRDKGIFVSEYNQLEVLGYLQKVGYHRLSPYIDGSCDFDDIKRKYLFDKKLRILCIDMLETIENSLKSIIFYHLGGYFNSNIWYLDLGVYMDNYQKKNREYILDIEKRLKKYDSTVKRYFSKNTTEVHIPDYIFFDKLTFGEIVAIFRDLKTVYRKAIASYYGVNYKVFDSWIGSLRYLRNLCSHYEYLYLRKKMVYSIKGKGIDNVLGTRNSFAAYFLLIGVFQKLLIPGYAWSEKVIGLMNTSGISAEDIGLQNKNLPSKLTSEAWEVLLSTVYRKNIKNARLFCSKPIKTYTEAVETLFKKEETLDYSLEKMKEAVTFFGHPERKMKIVHVAGTNGKGSVCAMVFSILKHAGKKVGLFTSPHIVEVRERFQTEKEMISEQDFVDIVNQVVACPIQLSYFEKCVMIAFLYFSKMECEYVVLEVGMGGLLDSTNIVHPVITAITSIGIDHTAFLGNTLEEISVQKAGIIKPGVPIVYNHHNLIIEQTAHEKGAPLIFTDQHIVTNLSGNYQQKNAAIAYEIGKYLLGEEHREEILSALQKVSHPGRLQRLRKNLLIDGAHNVQGLETLKEYLKEYKSLGFEDSELSESSESSKFSTTHYCVAQKVGKDGYAILEAFDEVEEFILINSENTVMVERAEILREKLLSLKPGLRLVIKNEQEIMTLSKNHPQDLFVVFGSLYALGGFLKQS